MGVFKCTGEICFEGTLCACASDGRFLLFCLWVDDGEGGPSWVTLPRPLLLPRLLVPLWVRFFFVSFLESGLIGALLATLTFGMGCTVGSGRMWVIWRLFLFFRLRPLPRFLFLLREHFHLVAVWGRVMSYQFPTVRLLCAGSNMPHYGFSLTVGEHQSLRTA